jgi:hypothetical protein
MTKDINGDDGDVLSGMAQNAEAADASDPARRAADAENPPDGKAVAAAENPGQKAGGDDEKRKKQADLLVTLALLHVDLFHSRDDTAWADIRIEGRRETRPLKAKTFKRWLQYQYYKEQGTSPSTEALATAVATLEGKAHYEGPEREVFTRVGGTDGKIYIDLADKDWRAIEVDKAGWRIVAESPIRFHRSGTMRPLDVPVRGGTVVELRKFVNVLEDHEFVLLICYLLAALRPKGPYPVLTLHGPPGAAKTTMTRVLRELIDPATPINRQLPKEKDELFIGATNNWVLPFENVSSIPAWLSDALCVLATGGGMAKRELYTTADERTFDVQRPVILNGIEDFVVRGDLADRAMTLPLQSIPDKSRQAEEKFWSEFEKARPRILGALLDLVSIGLVNLPGTRLNGYPRMADFAVWSTACEGKAGLLSVEGAPVWFAEAYRLNREDASWIVLEGNLVARALRKLPLDVPWEGTATELLERLNPLVGEHPPRGWPSNSTKLSGKLRAIKGHLPAVGITVDFLPGHHPKKIKLERRLLEKDGNLASLASQRPNPNKDNGLAGTIGGTLDGFGTLDRDQTRDTRDAGDAGENPGSPSKPLKTNERDARDARDAKFPNKSGKDDPDPAADVKAVQPNGENLQSRDKLSRLAGDGKPDLKCDLCGRPGTPDRGPVIPGEFGKLHAGCLEEHRARRRYDGLEEPPAKTDGEGGSPPPVVLDPADPESVAQARQRFNAVAARWDKLKPRLVPPELNAGTSGKRDLSFKLEKEGDVWRVTHPAFLGVVAEAPTRDGVKDKLQAVLADRFRVPASEVTVAPNLPVAIATAIPQ